MTIKAQIRLISPQIEAWNFSMECDSDTPFSEVQRAIELHHGGSIRNVSMCINRYHPEEIVDIDETFTDYGISNTEVVIFYDYPAEGGALLS